MKKLLSVLAIITCSNTAFGVDITSGYGKIAMEESTTACMKSAFSGGTLWIHHIFDYKRYSIIKDICVCAMEKTFIPMSDEELMIIGHSDNNSEVVKQLNKTIETNLLECLNNN